MGRCDSVLCLVGSRDLGSSNSLVAKCMPFCRRSMVLLLIVVIMEGRICCVISACSIMCGLCSCCCS